MSAKLQKLREQRSELYRKMQSLTDKADGENRDFTSDEDKEFKSMEQDYEGLVKRIEREEKMDERSRELGEPASAAVYEPASKEGVESRGKPAGEQKKAWSSFGEQLLAVREAASPGGRVDPRLLETRAISGMSETVPSDGGFLLQHDFAETLLKRTYEVGVLASKVTRIPISQKATGLKMNAIDEDSRATGSRWGGVQTYWVAEGGTVTPTKPKFRQIEMNVHKLAALCYATDELISDATALEAIIMEAFASEISFQVDDAILRGDGAGKPQGILNSGCLVTQAKETGQTAATINKENIVNMRSRLWARSRQNSVWFINQDCEPSLNLLTLGDLGAYFPAGSFVNQPYDQLFGRPVLPIEHASTLGTVGDINLFDLSQYLMIDKGAPQSASSVHVRFLYDESVFRFIYRCDGQPAWKAPLTPYKGTATKSPFVTLATRA